MTGDSKLPLGVGVCMSSGVCPVSHRNTLDTVAHKDGQSMVFNQSMQRKTNKLIRQKFQV